MRFGSSCLGVILAMLALASIGIVHADTNDATATANHCYEFPVVVVSAVDRSFPDPTCNQLRYPAADCLKASVHTRVEVIDHQDGSHNCYGAAPTEVYTAKSNYRGQTSLFFPKHQMNIKFAKNTPFLGLPEDKAFILNGPYLDCSLLRNHLAHWLYRSTGRYSPRTRHVAMYFKDTLTLTEPRYMGIYLLLEKLTYGPNRVNLAVLDTECTDKEDLSGGWAWQNDPLSYGSYSPNMVIDQYQNEFGMGERPILAYPPGEELSQKMRDYFVNTSTGFLPQLYRFLWNNMTNPDGLEAHLDLGSFADYILHTEMSLNVDAYRRSTFFFKDRNQPINAGPVWDLNLAYGNGARKNFHDWIYPQYTYWKRLMCNYKLTSLIIQRWKELRGEDGAWSDESITKFIDDSAAPIQRQLSKCPNEWRSDVLQCAAVSLADCHGSYTDQLETLKQAVLARSRWMDEHIMELYKPLDAQTCSGVGTLPKYNCAADGDDDGCLSDPESYYSAVKFPSVRKPYSGSSCAEKADSNHNREYKLSSYEQPSVDHCWRSAGIYVYPQQKGVREKNLTHFCNGYGLCPQGPGATCSCKPGILVEEGSCRRIDAENEDYMSHAATNLIRPAEMAADTRARSGWMDSVTQCGPLVVFIVGIAMIVMAVFKIKQRTLQRERMNAYPPVRYGSVDNYNVITGNSMLN